MKQVEGKLVNKVLYKIELYLIKHIPIWIALCYFLNTVLSYYCIDVPILSLIGGMSILPWIFLFISSYVFKFCIYHRLPLYYILISDIIGYYDTYIGISISNRTLFSIYCIIAGIFLFLMLYFKFKLCKKQN